MIIFIIWFIGWMVTWPALLANAQERWALMAEETFRENLGMSMFFAIFPPIWVLTPFVTRFYEHGFQFRRKSK